MKRFIPRYILVLLIVVVITNHVGCVKRYVGSDGSITEFVTGIDFNLGANGVDEVQNERGIKPGGGIQSAPAKK